MRANRKIESEARLSLREAAYLQAMEGKPLDAEQFAMFEMFDREGWSDEERHALLMSRALQRAAAVAAE